MNASWPECTCSRLRQPARTQERRAKASKSESHSISARHESETQESRASDLLRWYSVYYEI